MRDFRTKLTLAAFAALVLTGSATGGASALTLINLKDTGAGLTSVLNTTGELTGGDAAVPASATGVSFLDVGLFSIESADLQVSFNVISQGATKIAEISGGEAGLYEEVSGSYFLIASTLIGLQSAPPGVVSQLASFSGVYDLTPGNYAIGIESVGVDTVATQGDAKFSVAVEGVDPISAPEPSTWAMLLLGFVGLGFAGHRRSRGAAAAV